MSSTSPTFRTRIAAIDTDLTPDLNYAISSSTSTPNDIPSLRISQVPSHSNTTSPIRPIRHQANPTNRARTESRKLLAHVLAQLESRAMPPDIFDTLNHPEDLGTENNLGALLNVMRGTSNPRKVQQESRRQASMRNGEDSDSDADEEHEFSTDATYGLMLQLKDLLSISVDQDWHILDDNPATQPNDVFYEAGSKSPMSPFRRTRTSFQPGGHRSRSHSPSYGGLGPTRTSDLLSTCISVLASVVLEDCRYQIASPRPSCPPNALQALTLDVAQFLLHTHRHDFNVTSKIGFAMIPAFSTFRPAMHGRLLTFFENAVIRCMLEDLAQIQGVNDIVPSTNDFEKPLNSAGSSVVAIHIDAVQELPHPGLGYSRWKPWSMLPDHALKLRSTYAPAQSMALYSFSSLVAPLIAAILDSVDLEPKPDARTDVLHRFRRLLRLIVESKFDAYSDVLQVVGHHTHRARHIALSILCAVWPNAIGHVVISRPFTDLYHLDTALPQQQTSVEHNFVPWRFVSQNASPDLSVVSQTCHSCSRLIHGFGLFCPLCACGVHFDCYEHSYGNKVVQYSLSSDHSIQRMAVYRFSRIPVDPDVKELVISKHGHDFRPVNVFTLCLCLSCRKPLWGCASQGLSCKSCTRFVHSNCLNPSSSSDVPPCSSKNLSSDLVDITWDELHRSFVDFYRDLVQYSYDDLTKLSYEEVSIMHSILWVQAQIISNGVTLGSVVIARHAGMAVEKAEEYGLQEFELHSMIRWCESLLSSDKLSCSNALDDYLEGNALKRSDHLMMFNWTHLMYIRSIIQSPYTEQSFSHGSSSDLLSVTQPGFLHTSPSNDSSSYPFDIVPLSHMRDALGHVLNVHSDAIARIFLSHLHRLGLFERIDGRLALFDGENVTNIYCSFPLPFGLDLSPSVEGLVAAVEGCLQDLDLSVIEVGLLLLVRRLWPNGLTSDYALRRLTRCVVSWILAEDDHLAIVLRDYLGKGQPLPGVRPSQDPITWPLSDKARSTSANSNNGGDYLATRRSLLMRYAKPWLQALHSLDSVLYASLVFDTCTEVDFIPLSADHARTSSAFSKHNQVLRHITRLSNYQIVFTAFDDLFLLWLESTSQILSPHEPMHSLSRLFSREPGNSSEKADPTISKASVVPWRVVTRIASGGQDGLQRSLQWLWLFARSGVDIPLTIFETFSALAAQYNSPLSESLLMARGIMASTWLKPKGRQEIQGILSRLHERHKTEIIGALRDVQPSNDVVSFIRLSLSSCLLLYGCERGKLTDLGIILETDTHGLISRKKINPDNSVVVDPVVVDPQLMAALDRYIGSDSDDICCLIGKFLYLFLTGSPYVESYEVDNFVLRNGRTLAACAWRLYQAQVPEMSEIRAHYLLRTLVVDADPFKRIMEVSFLQTSHWERRLLAITHLFRVILDVINPSFNIEDRQWRSSVADVFFYFFSSQWADQSEEIRVAVETLSATLLPSHHQAISLCWNETLLKSPVSERLKLVTFLIQLHRHFPRWQVLAWDAIVESLMEERFDEDSPAAARLSVYGLPSTSDPDLAELRVSTMSLSLQMIADGIEIDSFRLLKIKNHLVEVVGFRDVLTAPTYNGQWFQVHFGELSDITDIALPCVNQFLAVMDASHTVEVSPSVMVGANDADERPVTILVGSIFIDAFLSIICMGKDLASLPIMTFKNLLETLCIVIYKHDFESPVLRHLQSRLRLAVTRSLDCLALDISYDVRQLALSVVQAYVKRWHSVMGSFIYGSIESIAKMVASQSQHHGQDALVVQAKAFLDTTLTRYAQNGLFANLLRRPMEQEFFFILKQVVDSNAKNNPQLPQSLRELLLRDVLTRAIEGDNTTFQNVLDNTLTYVAIVYHEGFTSEMMQFSGQQLIQFSRRAAEWGPDSINPDPLLKICAILLQHNKTFGRDILPSIDTVMRVLLSRLKVGVEGLSSLLQVTHTLHRKPTANDASTAHPILALLFEVLGDGLRLKARILPSTLNSIAEAITTTEYGGLPPIVKHLSLFLVLVDPAVHFLQNHSWQDVESDFKASLCIARIILQVSMQDLAIMRKLADYAEKTAHTNLKVRSWSILALAALLEKKEDWYSALFGQFSSFSYAYHSSIRGYTQGTSSFETAVVDLNYAYIAVKLWILLAYRVSGSGDVVKDSQAFRIWNELWPPFDSILKQFEVDPGGGLYSAIGTLVLSSVADLLVFMRTLHTPIALQASSHITTLNRLRQLTPGAIGNQKVNRALRSMSEAPPESSLETLIDQTAKDIMAAEKLRVLEAQAQAAQDRKAAERSRRDIRTVS